MKWFCWHDWMKWSEAYSIGIYRYQDRLCKKCGKRIVRQFGFSMWIAHREDKPQ